MREKLFAPDANLEVAGLKQSARDLGLDTTKFDACLDSGAQASAVAEHRKAGERSSRRSSMRS